MVPVFNWFYLKGRCRDCGARISPRYPGVEAAGGILAVWCFFVYRTDPARAVLSFLAASLLLTIALIDWDTMEIPDGLNLSLAVLAVFSAVLFPEPGISSRMLGMVCVSLPMYLFCFVIDGAFGGGDIKLLGAMGFFLGWKALVSGAVFGFFFGGLEAIYLLATGKARRGEGAHMAFGPALCAGLFLAELYGESMISWYFGLFS